MRIDHESVIDVGIVRYGLIAETPLHSIERGFAFCAEYFL
jgi:hypothetical protein